MHKSEQVPPPMPVELHAHQSRWAEDARLEAERLTKAIGKSLMTVHHIGSTAIPSIHAKPIIDLIPVFSDPDAADAARPEFERLGYRWLGEFGLPGRRFCTLDDAKTGRRLVHAHGYVIGNPEIDRHLAFRDYLRHRPEVAAEYAEDKQRCRDLHPMDSLAYSNCKNDWIRRIEAEAVRWHKRSATPVTCTTSRMSNKDFRSMHLNSRIVVFDLGGVLVRVCRNLKEAGDRCGVEVRPDDLTPERDAERRSLQVLYERGRMASDEFFEAIARTAGGRFSQAQYRAMHEAVIIEEYEGVSQLIDDVHAAGATTGVLSNTNHAHWTLQVPSCADGHGRPALVGFPAVSKVVHKHASHLLGTMKPDAEIYHEFARRTGFSSASIIFFDDLRDNVEAARAAGWKAHQIDHTGDTAAQMRKILAPLLNA